MNEAETRAEHIDPALRAAGWGTVEGSRIMREYHITVGRLQGHGKRTRPDIADYVLVYRNHMLAVLEAKRWDSNYTQGLAQAKKYAQMLEARFAYSSNGQKIYCADITTGKEGDVDQYSSPQKLWSIVFAGRNAWRDRFAATDAVHGEPAFRRQSAGLGDHDNGPGAPRRDHAGGVRGAGAARLTGRPGGGATVRIIRDSTLIHQFM